MDSSTILEICGIILGGGSVIGFIVGLLTIKWQRLKAKAEAKGADAEADMKRQDYYQEMMEDMQKDRERMKTIRDEQEKYISELKADREQLRNEKESLRKENDDLRLKINSLEDKQREQDDKIAGLTRLYNALKPLMCSNVGCTHRQADILGLVADDSFDTIDSQS